MAYLFFLLIPAAVALAFTLRERFAPGEPDHTRCARCQYALAGLPWGVACPECGHDPLLPPPPPRRLPPVAWAAFVPQVLLVPTAAVVWAPGNGLWGLLCCTLSAMVPAFCIHRVDGRIPRPAVWTLLAAAAFPGLVVSLSSASNLQTLAGAQSSLPNVLGPGFDVLVNAILTGLAGCAGFTLAALGVLAARRIRGSDPL
jgi:hypothetical protein